MSAQTTRFYFLWQAVDALGKKIYLQLTSTSLYGERVSVTYYPEFATRATDRFDMEKMLITVKSMKNTESTIQWTLILINMEIQQQSWAIQPAIKEYANILKDISLYPLSESEQLALDKHKKEMERKYANSRV